MSERFLEDWFKMTRIQSGDSPRKRRLKETLAAGMPIPLSVALKVDDVGIEAIDIVVERDQCLGERGDCGLDLGKSLIGRERGRGRRESGAPDNRPLGGTALEDVEDLLMGHGASLHRFWLTVKRRWAALLPSRAQARDGRGW